MNKMPKSVRSGTLILLCAIVLAVTCAVGYTVAWLSDTHKLETVVFADSDIKIDFDDEKSKDTAKLIPGHTVDKAPVVTVKKDSEKCYLFVKVEKNIGDNGESLLDGAGNTIAEFDDFITYSIIEADAPDDEEGWVRLTDKNGNDIEDVYYRVVEASDEDQVYRVLKGGTHTMGRSVYTWEDDQVLVNPEITLEMQSALTDENCPELSFVAYAIQYYKSNELPFEAYEAWANVSA